MIVPLIAARLEKNIRLLFYFSREAPPVRPPAPCQTFRHFVPRFPPLPPSCRHGGKGGRQEESFSPLCSGSNFFLELNFFFNLFYSERSRARHDLSRTVQISLTSSSSFSAYFKWSPPPFFFSLPRSKMKVSLIVFISVLRCFFIHPFDYD